MFNNRIKPKSPIGQMMLFASVAVNLNPGDLVEFRQSLHGRAQINNGNVAALNRSPSNTKIVIPRNTQAKVRSVKRLSNGSYTLELQIKSGANAGRKARVNYDPSNPTLRRSNFASSARATKSAARTAAPIEEDRLGKLIEQIMKNASSGPAVQTATCSSDTPLYMPPTDTVADTVDTSAPDEAPLSDEHAPFLRSSSMIQTDAPEIVEMARKITAGKNGALAKSRAIYEWVATNINYDDKVKDLRTDGIAEDSRQDALFTLQSRNAVCEGYADLFAALHRAIGIPTKMVLGKSNRVNVSANGARFLINNGRKLDLDSIPVYHTWNEVYVNGRWIPVDSTTADLSPTAIDPYTSPAEYFDLTHKKIEVWDR